MSRSSRHDVRHKYSFIFCFFCVPMFFFVHFICNHFCKNMAIFVNLEVTDRVCVCVCVTLWLYSNSFADECFHFVDMWFHIYFTGNIKFVRDFILSKGCAWYDATSVLVCSMLNRGDWYMYRVFYTCVFLLNENHWN